VRDELILAMEQTEYLELIEQWLETVNARVPTQLLGGPITPDIYIHTMVDMAFSLLPALAVLAVDLLALAAQMTCTHAFVATGLSMMATRHARLFILSMPSAIIFLLAGIVSLFSSGTTVFSALALNLTVILFPAMCIVGTYKLVADFKARFSPLTLILIIAAVLFAPRLLFFGVAVSGAVTTLIRPLITRLVLEHAREHKGDGSDNDSQGGDDRRDQ
jgi:hypothetical protein